MVATLRSRITAHFKKNRPASRWLSTSQQVECELASFGTRIKANLMSDGSGYVVIEGIRAGQYFKNEHPFIAETKTGESSQPNAIQSSQIEAIKAGTRKEPVNMWWETGGVPVAGTTSQPVKKRGRPKKNVVVVPPIVPVDANGHLISSQNANTGSIAGVLAGMSQQQKDDLLANVLSGLAKK